MSDLALVDAERGWRMVLRRTAALLAGEGIARVVGFVAVLLLARRVEPDGFGVITLGLTLVTWFAFVVDSGTELLNVKEVSRRPGRFREISEPILGLRLVLSLAAAAVFVVAVEVLSRSDFTRNTLVLFALVLPAMALNLRWIALGIGGSRAIAAGNIASRVVVLAGVLLFVLDVSDVQVVPLLEAGGEALYALIVLGLAVWRLGPIVPRVDLALWLDTLRQSLPLMVNGLTRAVIFSFDVVLIGLVLGPDDVGIYGVAIRPVDFAASAIGLFALSYLSAFSATGRDDAAALHGRALRLSVAACVGLAAILSLAAPLIPYVFGDAYSDAVPVLAVLAWRIPFLALGGMYITVLVARDRQLTLMWNGIVTAVVVVALDLAAVLSFGLMGAAAASVVASALVFLVNYRSVRRDHPELRVRTAAREAG